MTVSYNLAPIHACHEAGSNIDNAYAVDYILCSSDRNLVLLRLKHSIFHVYVRKIENVIRSLCVVSTYQRYVFSIDFYISGKRESLFNWRACCAISTESIWLAVLLPFFPS